jgi:hypothetical protein
LWLHGSRIRRFFREALEDLFQDMLHPETDEMHKALTKARAFKITNWIRKPSVPKELIVSCLALQVANNLMGWLFTMSAAEAGASILELKAPADQLPQFLLNKLEDLEDSFWLVLARGGWTAFTCQLALDTFLRLGASAFYRMCIALRQWPWRLTTLVDPHATLEQKMDTVEQMSSACEECLDAAFTAEVKRLKEPAAGLVDPQNRVHKTIYAAFRRVPASNLLSETRFSRMSKASGVATTMGQPGTQATLAAKHVLAEHASQHRLKADAHRKRNPRPVCHSQPQTSKARSAWHLFFGRQRQQGSPVAEIAAAWRALTKDEHAELIAEAALLGTQRLEQVDLEPVPGEPFQAPWGLGDLEWPVSPAAVSHLSMEPGAIIAGHQRWVSNNGAMTCPPAVEPHARPKTRLCGHMWGLGRCKEQFSKNEQDAFKANLQQLRKLVSIDKSERHLQLYCFRARDDPERNCFLVLSVWHLLRDPEVSVFCKCTLEGPLDYKAPEPRVNTRVPSQPIVLRNEAQLLIPMASHKLSSWSSEGADLLMKACVKKVFDNDMKPKGCHSWMTWLAWLREMGALKGRNDMIEIMNEWLHAPLKWTSQQPNDMNERTNEWRRECMDGWVEGMNDWMYWMNGWMVVWRSERMDEWVDMAWMNGWTNEWMNAWMDGWINTLGGGNLGFVKQRVASWDQATDAKVYLASAGGSLQSTPYIVDVDLAREMLGHRWDVKRWFYEAGSAPGPLGVGLRMVLRAKEEAEIREPAPRKKDTELDEVLRAVTALAAPPRGHGRV